MKFFCEKKQKDFPDALYAPRRMLTPERSCLRCMDSLINLQSPQPSNTHAAPNQVDVHDPIIMWVCSTCAWKRLCACGARFAWPSPHQHACGGSRRTRSVVIGKYNCVQLFSLLVYTYGSILGRLGLAALECDAVALVLEALGGDEALNTGSLGVWLLSLALGLDFTADNELADL